MFIEPCTGIALLTSLCPKRKLGPRYWKDIDSGELAFGHDCSSEQTKRWDCTVVCPHVFTGAASSGALNAMEARETGVAHILHARRSLNCSWVTVLVRTPVVTWIPSMRKRGISSPFCGSIPNRDNLADICKPRKNRKQQNIDNFQISRDWTALLERSVFRLDTMKHENVSCPWAFGKRPIAFLKDQNLFFGNIHRATAFPEQASL